MLLYTASQASHLCWCPYSAHSTMTTTTIISSQHKRKSSSEHERTCLGLGDGKNLLQSVSQSQSVSIRWWNLPDTDLTWFVRRHTVERVIQGGSHAATQGSRLARTSLQKASMKKGVLEIFFGLRALGF